MTEKGQFVGHTNCDECGSSDAVAVYEQSDGTRDGYCWSGCVGTSKAYKKPSQVGGKEVMVNGDGKPKKPREPITEAQKSYIEKIAGFQAKNYRGIADTVLKYTGIRTEVNEDGDVVCRYYPTHHLDEDGNYILVGYKRRYHPKDFTRGPVGQANTSCALLGQNLHRRGSARRLLIVAGEEDYAAATQMLRAYQVKANKSHQEKLPVVSPLTGESGSLAQLKNNMDYLDSFEQILICYDNDKAGREASEKVASILPEGRAYIVQLPQKDVNKMLENGQHREFIDCYFNATLWSPSEIKDSGDVDFLEDAITRALIPRIPLPPFLEGVTNLLCGGIPLGVIVNIGSGSGCVDADTEFMTPSGWKKFDQYEYGDEVLQFNPDGSSEFVQPNQYIKLPAKTLDRITNQHVDMYLSDEHRVVYQSERVGKNYTDLCWSEVKQHHLSNVDGWTGRIPVSFEHKGGRGIDLTEGELRLQIAVMADGRIKKNSEDNFTQMRFLDERKYNRLIRLCKKYDMKYDDRGWRKANRYSSEKFYEVVVWPKLNEKNFDNKYFNCTRAQLEIILDELSYWNGYHKSELSFSTTKKSDADFIQFVCHALGCRSTLTVDKRRGNYYKGWCVTVTRNSSSHFTSISRSSKEDKAQIQSYETKDGFKYCFRVPSGMLVLRKNDKIFVTGNSGKSTIVNECVYHWIFNSPHKVGVVSLEATAGEYYTNVLSRHLKRKIELIRDPQERIDFLSSEYVRNESNRLRINDQGEGRFTLLDDRGDIGSIKKNIETMIKVKDCKVIVLDPLQDILDEVTTEDEAKFLRWQKGIVQKHEVTIININHTRKSQSGKKSNSRGAQLDEEDFAGCVDKDTEYLTPYGWKKISEWVEGDLVAEVTESGDMTFNKAEFIKLPMRENFYHFTNKTAVDMMLSSEHKILFSKECCGERQGEYTESVAEYLGSDSKYSTSYLPVTFKVEEGRDLPEAYVQLLVMVATDGCYHGKGRCKMEFKKGRKMTRAEYLLKKNNITYTTSITKKGTTVFRFDAPTECKQLHKMYNWYTAKRGDLETLYKEIPLWEGSVNPTIFSSVNKEESDVVQFAAAACGVRASLNKRSTSNGGSAYPVGVCKEGSFRNKVLMAKSSVDIDEVKSIDGYKYCFKTSTGFFVARRKNRIFLTGNSSTIYKSGAINIIVTRDKMADDPVVRNTIRVDVTKARGSGFTGNAGFVYYEPESHTLHQMTDELKAELEANIGGTINSTTTFSEIPEGFLEDDLINAEDSPI